MRVSRYTEWAFDLESSDYFLWTGTTSSAPVVVRVSREQHEELLNARQSREVLGYCNKVLLESGIIRNEDTDPLGELISENVAEAADSRVLRRVVLPSAKCPHGCGKAQYGNYCGQHHTNQRLSNAVRESLIEDISSQLSGDVFDALSLGFFGAEPLTAVGEIETILQESRKICDALGKKFSASIITSGLLYKKVVAQRLFRLGLSVFEITLDGCKANHDARRPTLLGRGTFDIIYRNLCDISQDSSLAELSGTIRMNVDARNAGDILPLFEMLVRDGLWPRYTFYVSQVRDWGQAEAGTLYSDRMSFGKLESSLLAAQLRCGANIKLLPPRNPVVCTAVMSGAAVIDPYGTLHQCTETPLAPEEMPGWVSSSTRPDWSSEWAQRVQGDLVPCSRCNLLPACGGSCPKDWMLGRQPCPSFKSNFKQRIQLTSLFQGNVSSSEQ